MDTVAASTRFSLGRTYYGRIDEPSVTGQPSLYLGRLFLRRELGEKFVNPPSPVDHK